MNFFILGHQYISSHKVVSQETITEKSDSFVTDTDTCDTCDTDSCISSDKCYCSLRGDPRHGHRGGPSPSIYSDLVTDTGHSTDTTCYSTCSHSYVSRHNLSGIDSPQTAWKRNMVSTRSGSGLPGQ